MADKETLRDIDNFGDTDEADQRTLARDHYDDSTPHEGKPLAVAEVDRRFSALQTQVATHIDEPVLLITRSWEQVRYGWLPYPHYYEHETFFMGIPTKDGLRTEPNQEGKEMVVLDTNEHAVVEPDLDRGMYVIAGMERGPITSPKAPKTNLDRPSLSAWQMKTTEARPMLEIVVGTDNISKWVTENTTPRYNRALQIDRLKARLKIDTASIARS